MEPSAWLTLAQHALDVARASLTSAAQWVIAAGRSRPTAAAFLIAAAVTLLAAFLLSRRSGRRVTRSRRARILAARGLPVSQIARQTGLSRDAVGLILAMSTLAAGRRKLPRTARFAGRRESSAPSGSLRQPSQAYAGAGVMMDVGSLVHTARPLPRRRSFTFHS